MRELTIGKNDAGQRVDRFVSKALPLLPPALLQKYIRLKRIKRNGKGAKRDVRLVGRRPAREQAGQPSQQEKSNAHMPRAEPRWAFFGAKLSFLSFLLFLSF